MRNEGLTAEQAISRYKEAGVRRRFPAEYLGSTIEEIEHDAEAGDQAAKTALKLLFSRRFDKR